MGIRDKAIAKADQVNASLMSSPIVKGLLDTGIPCLFPVVGPGILSALDKRAAQLAEKNSKLFAEELKRHIDSIAEDKLDKAFVESDEFVSLLINVLARNARAHEEEKVKFYAALFMNAVMTPTSSTSYKEGFVQIIDELGVDHIRVLSHIESTWRALSDEDRKKNGKDFSATAVAQALHMPEHRAIAYCDQMMRFGLLRDPAVGRFGYKPGYYAITDYGSELMSFLTMEGQAVEKGQVETTKPNSNGIDTSQPIVAP